MIREYIFCSVMESPQMARRSLGWSRSFDGLGAGTGLNFSWRVCAGHWNETSAEITSTLKAAPHAAWERRRLAGEFAKWMHGLVVSADRLKPGLQTVRSSGFSRSVMISGI